jgi:hypothetical protein
MQGVIILNIRAVCVYKVYAVQNYSLQSRKGLKVGLDGVKCRPVENTDLKMYRYNSLRTPSLAEVLYQTLAAKITLEKSVQKPLKND